MLIFEKSILRSGVRMVCAGRRRLNPQKRMNGGQEIVVGCLDIPNGPLATKSQPLKIGDFSENHGNPRDFFAEIHSVEPKTVSIHLNPHQNLKNYKTFF